MVQINKKKTHLLLHLRLFDILQLSLIQRFLR